jgi:hypothetical protein
VIPRILEVGCLVLKKGIRNVKKHMFLTITQIFTRAKGPLAASAHEVDTAQVRVLIGCVFVEIVIESETCHICRAVLLTI